MKKKAFFETLNGKTICCLLFAVAVYACVHVCVSIMAERNQGRMYVADSVVQP